MSYPQSFFQADVFMYLDCLFEGRSGKCTASVLRWAVVLVLALIIDTSSGHCETNPWRELEDGLLVGEFETQPKPPFRDARILLVKVDPQKYSLKLLSASENGGKKMTVREWTEKYHLVAAFNAGMYQTDGATSVGYMKNFKHINNGRLNINNSVLAFNRVDASVPEIQIIDRECQDFGELKGKYQSFVQSIRMVSCEQKNVWSQQPTGWSTLAIGMDKNHNVLIIFSQQPYSVHDLIEILLSLPISIYNAMYLEGGPQASLYMSTENGTIERYGGWEGSPDSHIPLPVWWPIPNVIGIVRK
jgi:uncharacterized protein YigE (DUF2233 family)